MPILVLEKHQGNSFVLGPLKTPVCCPGKLQQPGKGRLQPHEFHEAGFFCCGEAEGSGTVLRCGNPQLLVSSPCVCVCVCVLVYVRAIVIGHHFPHPDKLHHCAETRRLAQLRHEAVDNIRLKVQRSDRCPPGQFVRDI